MKLHPISEVLIHFGLMVDLVPKAGRLQPYPVVLIHIHSTVKQHLDNICISFAAGQGQCALSPFPQDLWVGALAEKAEIANMLPLHQSNISTMPQRSHKVRHSHLWRQKGKVPNIWGGSLFYRPFSSLMKTEPATLMLNAIYWLFALA